MGTTAVQAVDAALRLTHLQAAIKTKEDLPEMLDQARREEPLDGWGGIKVATQEDLKGP